MNFLRTRRHSDHYKWWVLSCTSLGMLLATLNSGTLIIALPELERSLHTTLLQLVWVILVYMIASTVLLLSAGRLSALLARVARRRLRRQRHAADPLAHRPGHRRRVPVCERGRARHRRVPEAP